MLAWLEKLLCPRTHAERGLIRPYLGVYKCHSCGRTYKTLQEAGVLRLDALDSEVSRAWLTRLEYELKILPKPTFGPAEYKVITKGKVVKYVRGGIS